MKKTKIIALLIVLLFSAGSLFAQYDDPGAPGRHTSIAGQQNWKARMLNKQLFVGLQLAQRMTYTYTDAGGGSTSVDADEINEVNQFFGFNARYYFPQSRWGVGFEALLMDHVSGSDTAYYETYWGSTSYTYNSFDIYRWLVDVDLLFRTPLTPKIMLNAGAGLTYQVVTWEVTDGSYTDSGSYAEGSYGLNAKVGAEIFFSDMISGTIDVKWHWWNTGVGEEQLMITSVVAGVHISL